jgi:hypothetical protein
LPVDRCLEKLLPTRPAELRAWLDRRYHVSPGPAGVIYLLGITDSILSTDYLTPAQHVAQAALNPPPRRADTARCARPDEIQSAPVLGTHATRAARVTCPGPVAGAQSASG